MPDPSVEKPKLNMKEMGFKKSVIHLWTYYKWYAIIPLIIIYAIFQKQFIEGIALTGIKG